MVDHVTVLDCMCTKSKLDTRMSISRKCFTDYFFIILRNFVEILDLTMWRISYMEFSELKIYAISNTLLALNSFAASKILVFFNIKASSLFYSTISYQLIIHMHIDLSLFDFSTKVLLTPT